ncbi:MAG: hypothetical protein H6869_08470 [Rhodospirillales bacterium]|nr:hypothetical protein [Rhodospirillales bacterium]
MDENNIEDRLKEATSNCLSSHGEWDKNKKDSKARETLMEAVHELRKVAARLEIEIAISERDEMASKPIPIPPHRSNKRKMENNVDDNVGNQGDGDNSNKGGPKPQRNRPRRRTGTDSPSSE